MFESWLFSLSFVSEQKQFTRPSNLRHLREECTKHIIFFLTCTVYTVTFQNDCLMINDSAEPSHFDYASFNKTTTIYDGSIAKHQIGLMAHGRN